MKRLEPWVVVAGIGSLVAVYDLVTGWTVKASGPALIVVLGLFAGSIALFAGELMAGIRDRERISRMAQVPYGLVAHTARGLRWNGVFAAALAVLLFADCSGGVSSGNSLLTGGPMVDASRYWSLASWLLLPLLIALLLPASLATAAERVAERRPETALRFAEAATWSVGLLVVIAGISITAGFFFGISECFFGTSPGACAAGVGSTMNVLSLGALALYIPYLGLMTRALRRPPAT